MSARNNQLKVPPEALSDPDGFEIMRLWAAHGQLHTVISGEIGGGPADFGELLADLFEHASRMFSERQKLSVEECRNLMLNDFLLRIEEPKPSLQGSVEREH